MVEDNDYGTIPFYMKHYSSLLMSYGHSFHGGRG